MELLHANYCVYQIRYQIVFLQAIIKISFRQRNNELFETCMV